MKIHHEPIVFQCDGSRLLGIFELPEKPRSIGVLIVTGGPQYRIGSHRQFVLISRKLAEHGFPTMRFDFRGMGDSQGEQTGFDECSKDLCAAIDSFVANTEVQEIVLWGLCDAASACMIYCSQDRRLTAMVLVNPWVRSESGKAQAYVKYYYVQHLFSIKFWRRLASGQVHIMKALSNLAKNLFLAAVGRFGVSRDMAAKESPSQEDFRDRMYYGFRVFHGQTLFLLCGADLTAAEFSDFTNQSRGWRRLMKKNSVTQRHMANMDHTFSKEEWREQIIDSTLDWIEGLYSKSRMPREDTTLKVD